MKRGADAPLRLSLLWLNNVGVFERGFAPLTELIPPPLLREGDKGGGLPNKNLKGIGWLNKKYGKAAKYAFNMNLLYQ